jgi:hypothetical protein
MVKMRGQVGETEKNKRVIRGKEIAKLRSVSIMESQKSLDI